jgi:hypothetical protein
MNAIFDFLKTRNPICGNIGQRKHFKESLGSDRTSKNGFAVCANHCPLMISRSIIRKHTKAHKGGGPPFGNILIPRWIER